MRILHIKADMRPKLGGSVSAVRALCEAARLVEDQAAIISSVRRTDLSNQALLQTAEHINFVRSDRSRFGVSWRMLWWLHRNVRYYDLVEIHEVFCMTSILTALMVRRSKTPYLVRPHGSLEPFDLRKHRRLKTVLAPLFYICILRDASAFCLTSEGERQRLVTFGSRSPRFVTPLPVSAPLSCDRDKSRAALALPPDAFVLLFLSRIDYKKGVERVLEAMQRLEESSTALYLLLAGEGEPWYVTQVDALIGELHLEHRVRKIGFITGAAKGAAFSAADAFVLVSDRENFGISIVEALMASLPVLLSKEIDIAEMLAEENAALVIPPTVDATTTALEQLIGDEPLREDLGRQAGIVANRLYDPSVVAAKDQRVRRRLLGWTPDTTLEQ